jgi:hypothetical protein
VFTCYKHRKGNNKACYAIFYDISKSLRHNSLVEYPTQPLPPKISPRIYIILSKYPYRHPVSHENQFTQ